MQELPPELAAFAVLLDAQPQPVQQAFQYYLCLLMVEAHRMELIDIRPGESAPIYVFESSNGEAFGIPRPGLTHAEEAEVKRVLREILRDEGLLD